MYLQLTTRCNMTCSHCCMSATTKGEDMPRDVFIAALDLAASYGEFITLGGGEPTIHREFFEYLDKTLDYARAGHIEGDVLVITNGKLKTKAMRLLDMIEQDWEIPLCVELSQDDYHDPIRPEVVERFRYYQRQRDRYYRFSSANHYPKAGIRTINAIVPVGRAADPARGLPINPHTKCACETPLVDPAGDVWSCGCKHTKLGTVFDSAVLKGYRDEFAHEGGFSPEEEQEEAA